MNWFKFIAYAPMIFEFLSHIIRQVEELRKSGEEKKKAVLETIEQFLKQLGIYSETIMKFISVAIDSYVLFYNITGLFTHSGK